MTRPDRPRLFLDALSGLDGTQAIRSRPDVLPVYPDASLGLPPRTRMAPAATAPATARPAGPAPAAAPPAVPQRAVPQRPRATAPRTPPRAAGAVPSAPYALPSAPYAVAATPFPMPAAPFETQLGPSRQTAARAGHYQGPVPLAVAPAAATAHNMPMTYAPEQFAQTVARTSVVRAPATQPAAFGAPPVRPPQPAQPLRARQRSLTPARGTKKKTSWVQALFALIIFALIGTGLGARILDWLRQLIDR